MRAQTWTNHRGTVGFMVSRDEENDLEAHELGTDPGEETVVVRRPDITNECEGVRRWIDWKCKLILVFPLIPGADDLEVKVTYKLETHTWRAIAFRASYGTKDVSFTQLGDTILLV